MSWFFWNFFRNPLEKQSFLIPCRGCYWMCWSPLWLTLFLVKVVHRKQPVTPTLSKCISFKPSNSFINLEATQTCSPKETPQKKHRINGHKWREHPFPGVSGGDNFPQPASNLLRLAHKCLGQFGLPGTSLATRFWEGSVRFTKKKHTKKRREAPKFGEIWTWNPPTPNWVEMINVYQHLPLFP